MVCDESTCGGEQHVFVVVVHKTGVHAPITELLQLATLGAGTRQMRGVRSPWVYSEMLSVGSVLEMFIIENFCWTRYAAVGLSRALDACCCMRP